MFNTLKPIPADPILKLLKLCQLDSNPQKVDLGVGIYKNEHGETPILNCVKKAEQYRLKNELTKSYLGPAGSELFNGLISELIFGKELYSTLNERIKTVSTPSGTAALKVAADFISRCKPNATLWVSDPTWANHTGVFESAGLKLQVYPYYDYASKSLKFDEMLTTLAQVSENDVVLFHACCHNPSGMDLTKCQWQKIISITEKNGFMPLIDMAYQGFSEGIDQDAYGVREMAAKVDNMIICSSCSKNFGLYRERIGACTIIAKNHFEAETALSNLFFTIRCIYSMPPAHGAAIVETILNSANLKAEWLDELKLMRNRINNNRSLLVEKLKNVGVKENFDFISKQHGMFSFLGINPQQVIRLRDEFSVYMLDSSRINIAGFNEENIDYLTNSIRSIL